MHSYNNTAEKEEATISNPNATQPKKKGATCRKLSISTKDINLKHIAKSLKGNADSSIYSFEQLDVGMTIHLCHEGSYGTGFIYEKNEYEIKVIYILKGYPYLKGYEDSISKDDVNLFFAYGYMYRVI